ncbi:hypothetical protein Tco_0340134 [Tanacetum coccineum]
MHDKGTIPHSSIKRQVKDGSSTRFWRDAWLGDIPLERKFPRLFCLEANKDCLVRDKWQNGWVWCWTRNFNGGVTGSQLDSLISMLVNVHLTEGNDAWHWSLIGMSVRTSIGGEDYVVLPVSLTDEWGLDVEAMTPLLFLSCSLLSGCICRPYLRLTCYAVLLLGGYAPGLDGFAIVFLMVATDIF